MSLSGLIRDRAGSSLSWRAHIRTLSGSVAAYEHEDLPTSTGIRLLRILKRSKDGQVQVEVTTFREETVPAYTALSYQWGSVGQRKKILVNGADYKITNNLWEFLDQMCNTCDYSWYWTDAICIDQANIDERHHQVARMGDIYRNASKVMIWLGRDARLNQSLAILISFWRLEHEGRLSDQSQLASNAGRSYNLLHPEDAARIVPDALTNVAQATYWTRMWIVQESILAKHAVIYCGLPHIYLGVLYLEQLESIIAYCRLGIARSKLASSQHAYSPSQVNFAFREPPGLDRIARIIRLRRQPTTPSLFELLDEFSNGESTVLHDRVYSLLGLVSPAGQVDTTIKVNYLKPVESLFWDVMSCCEDSLNWQGVRFVQLRRQLQCHISAQLFDELGTRSFQAGLCQRNPDLIKPTIRPGPLHFQDSQAGENSRFWEAAFFTAQAIQLLVWALDEDSLASDIMEQMTKRSSTSESTRPEVRGIVAGWSLAATTNYDNTWNHGPSPWLCPEHINREAHFIPTAPDTTACSNTRDEVQLATRLSSLCSLCYPASDHFTPMDKCSLSCRLPFADRDITIEVRGGSKIIDGEYRKRLRIAINGIPSLVPVFVSDTRNPALRFRRNEKFLLEASAFQSNENGFLTDKLID